MCVLQYVAVCCSGVAAVSCSTGERTAHRVLKHVRNSLTFIVYNGPLQVSVESQDALSLQVIFRERALQLMALLQKMTFTLRHPIGLRQYPHSNYPCRSFSAEEPYI